VNATDFVDSVILMLVLLNPLLMSAYLIDVIRELDTRLFIRVLVRAFVISGGVYLLFAWTGDVIFTGCCRCVFQRS
jgi:multiple antibiotic resistance protein